MLWVALCFFLTSAVYLSWLGRLVQLAGGRTADWISMVAGYLCQAAGMGVVAALLGRRSASVSTRAFSSVVALFAAIAVPTLIVGTAAGVICFGLLMNLLCGAIAGYYLYGIGLRADGKRRGLVFGGGYALATVAVGLLALVGRGWLLHGEHALLIYVPAALLLLPVTARLDPFADGSGSAAPAPDTPALKTETIILACAVVVLISAVKNLGFGFPSQDIEAGLVPELSRLPYAVGLAAAGLISDRSRRNGMVCTVAALIIPFIMLGLVGETVSRAFFWGLDYVFYGFFSVFRAALFLDIAARARRWEFAPLGLLAGRLGDALGTGVCLLLGSSKIALIALCAVLFVPAVFLLFRLHQRLYEPEAVREKSEQEVFFAFCQHNDLSARERDILRLIIANHTNGEIAEALFISENTVKFHVRNLLQKTGCKNRSELQKKYLLLLYPQDQDA